MTKPHRKSVIHMGKRRELHPISAEEKEFFEKLYEEEKNFMFYIAGKYTQSNSDREDIVQESVLRLLNNISTLKRLDCFKVRKYIVLTIKAVSLDYEKKKRVHRMILISEEMLETMLEADIVLRQTGPDDSVSLLVEQLKSQLSQREWFVLEGRYILGYSQEELGNLLGVNPNSVRMMICRARKKARDILYPGNTCGGTKYE